MYPGHLLGEINFFNQLEVLNQLKSIIIVVKSDDYVEVTSVRLVVVWGVLINPKRLTTFATKPLKKRFCFIEKILAFALFSVVEIDQF